MLESAWTSIIDIVYNFIKFPFEYLILLNPDLPLIYISILNMISNFVCVVVIISIVYMFIFCPIRWVSKTLGGFFK